MSDDVLRGARQFLAELEASEAYLRAMAVTALPWANVIAAERRAGRRCAELLAALGGDGFELRTAGFAHPVDDTTDELLTGAVRPRDVAAVAQEPARQTTANQGLAAPEVVGGGSFGATPAGAYEAFDDGPEGAADEGNDLRSESEEVDLGVDDTSLPEIEPEELIEDEDTDETPVPGPGVIPSPPPEPAPEPLVSFGDAAGSGSLVSFEEPVGASDDEPTLGSGSLSPTEEDPFGALVSFEEPGEPAFVEDEVSVDDEDGETVITTRPTTPTPAARVQGPADGRGATPPTAAVRATPAPAARFSDVGADALVTVEERSTDLLQESLSDDDIEELELDHEDSFDLMPDVADDDLASFEDEEVTMVRAAQAADGPKPVGAAASVGAPVARGDAPKPIRPAPPKPTAPVAVAAGGASAKVTAGLYGGSSVPTIRDSDEPRPRAAAIQLNAGGAGGKVIGLEEEEEPIEIGAAEDYEDGAEVDLAEGFSVTLQAHDEPDFDDVSEEEEEGSQEDHEVIEPARAPEPPPRPTPEQIQALLERAQAAAAAGDLQGGADLFSDVLDLDPDSVVAHVARGRLYLDLGDYSRAMSDFMVAEDIAPNDPEPQVAIGDLYFARKDYRKAIDYFNAALELSPNHPMAYCRRGISHYYRKNYPEALTDLLKAEKLDPDIPNIQTYVTMAKKKVKK